MRFVAPAEFARSHACDSDWIALMETQGRLARVLTPGDGVRYGEFDATIARHFRNSMYEVRVPGGVISVSSDDLVPVEPAASLPDEDRPRPAPLSCF